MAGQRERRDERIAEMRAQARKRDPELPAKRRQ
jgi:hypothetical protein